jgi:nucleotide-binding universal stress UspA family protein
MNDAPQRRVVAAVDNSLAGNPVLVTARALARVLGARVEGVHVLTDGEPPPDAAAAAVGVPLRVVRGPVVDRLAEACDAPETVAVVIGARSAPTSSRALGSTALAVVTTCSKPVVVVPPVARVAPILRRVLIPLEGTISTSLAPRSMVELGRSTTIEVVALHVDEDGCGDDEEFLRRFCPWGIGYVKLERRAGDRRDLVPQVAEELGCDLIALGWAQELSEGRAAVVRAALERSRLPIMLIPVRVEHRDAPGLVLSAQGGSG